MTPENIQPPRIFQRFFRWFCHPDLRKYIEGDLMELYAERVGHQGHWKANLLFAFDVILLFRPGIIRPPKNENLTTYGMYKSYFKIGWRNLLKNKGYSLINIGGLALGMAVFMIIGFWVWDELSFNQHLTNYNSIAQVMKSHSRNDTTFFGQRYLPYPLISELKTNYSQDFKYVIPSTPGTSATVLTAGETIVSKDGISMGEEAPEMLSLNMKYGTLSGLKDMYSILLSASTATALFGDQEPMGKSVKINNDATVIVAGVYEDFPKNTDFYGTDFIQPWAFHEMNNTWMKQQGWDNHFLWIYVQLQPNVSMQQAEASVQDAEKRVVGNLDYMQGELQYNPEIRLLPMRDWHLRSDFKEGSLQNGPVEIVWFIAAIGVFVLLLACINFMNLSTARSEKRAKEVGIRKAIGSIRRQLVGQFLSESMLTVILAFIISILFVAVSLPWFNDLAGKSMHIPWTEQNFWLGVTLFLLVTGFLAGSYPALYLSSFKPISVLKGTLRIGRFSSLPRKAMVIVQFTVSVALIISTGVVYDELMFVKDRPVGYDRAGLLMIRKKSGEYDAKADVLRTQLLNTGVVSEMSESGGEVTSVWSGNGGFNWAGKDPSFEANFATLNVSPEFGKTVGWRFIDGRDFSKEIASDSAGFVLNEAAVKYMGIENPVGKTMRWTNRAWGVDQDFRIVGVIKDMLMDSPFEPVKPTIYFTFGSKGVILVRIAPHTPASDALPKIDAVFRDVISDMPFDYKFVDQAFEAKFETGNRIGKLALVFTLFAIIISCLGLFGLASFVAERRTKEVGIRKVLGASVGSMWRMISGEFIWLVSISCVLAAPLSYYFMNKAIQEFTYRTAISIWIFVLAIGGAILLTLLTVGYQSIRAAMANPVNSLRSE